MVTAIIAAAGKGRRFGAAENKVFAPLAGECVLYWSMAALARCPAVDALVVVGAEDDLPRIRSVSDRFTKTRAVCAGGAERYDSVMNALAAVPEGTGLVAVHDGARPLVTPDLVTAVVEAARESGAALPATPVSDTLKRSEDGA